MKTDHKTLNEYMLWLAEQCKDHFDNDKDLIENDIKVSEDVLFEARNLSNIDFSKPKQDILLNILGRINAMSLLLKLAPGLIFCCSALICAWRWVYDNIEND